MDNLAKALRLEREVQVAIAGAGGKTTLLFRLARELGAPALLAASAHMGAWQPERAELHYSVGSASDLDFLEAGIPSRRLLFTGPLDVEKNRTRGLDAASLERLRRIARRNNLPLLIEADGARQHPLKVPAEHEPPVPPFVDTVLVVAGLSAIGRPVNEENVYGAERFAALSGLRVGQSITLEAVARILLHPAGGRKNIPPGARAIVLLNQADTLELRRAAREAAKGLLTGFDAVAITALEPDPFLEPLGSGALPAVDAVYEPAAAVVLAAGGSRRMGAPKLLLPWHGEPVIRHTVRAAVAPGVDQVIVVTGAGAQAVEAALADLPVTFVHNPNWAQGQGGSVAVGVRALAANTGAAVFLLGDQPQIPAGLVATLIEHHAHSHSQAIAPYVNARRGNPVLFDRALFGELAGLRGDAGGRQVLSRVQVEAMEWPDESILLDMDTPEDYDRLKRSP